MSDLFMVEPERLQALTGKKRPRDQITWLRENGYHFHVNHKGPVVVCSGGAPVKLTLPKPPKGLVRQETIIKSAIPLKSVCGVYFLISGSRIVYIGKSERVFSRINEHIRKGAIRFDAFHFIRVSKARLSAVEAEYIRAYKPPFNTAGKETWTP